MRNIFKQLTRGYYALERQYSQGIVLRRPITNTTDLATGAISRTYESITLKRIIVLEGKALIDFKYSLTYIAAAHNFTYGGYFNHTTRGFIIPKKKLPSNFVLDKLCTIIFYNHIFEIKDMEDIPNQQGSYLIVADSMGVSP